MSDVADGKDHTHEASSSHWRLSRRSLLGTVIASLVTACSSAPSVTPHFPLSTPTPKALLPAATISLSNVAQIRQLVALNTREGAVRGLAWSPDGKTLAVGTWNMVQLWDVATVRQTAAFQQSAAQMYQLAWSPEGQMLAAGSDDNSTRVWDVRNHRLLHTLQGTDNVVFSVAWSPRGDRLAAGNSDGVVQVWERATWHLAGSWNDPVTAGQFARGRYHLAAYTVAWSLDGRKLAATRYDGYARIWDAESGKLLHLLATSDQPNGLSWSPDGHLLASASDDGTVQLWDTTSFRNMRTLNADSGAGWAFALPWSPGGRLLACSRGGDIVQIWDAQAGQRLKILSGQRESIWAATWSPDNLRLASGSDDGTVYLWGVSQDI